MRAELIAVGTELLLGRIINTNTAILARRLAELGVDVYRHVTVGDNVERLLDAMREAASRAELVITIGGLGPTLDDVTRDAIVRFGGLRTYVDRAVLAHIRRRYRLRGMAMPAADCCMADVPEGAIVFPNHIGAAPGFAVSVERHWIVALPGPPSEMEPMAERNLPPFIRRIRPEPSLILSRTLKVTGMVESRVHRLIARWMTAQSPVTVGIYAGASEVDIVITAKAPSRARALRLIQPVERSIRWRLRSRLFATDQEELESVVGQLLVRRHATIAIAESCTGGLISHRLTNISGSSRYLLQSVVAYSNMAKETVLAVSRQLLQRHGAVSAPVATAMARGIRLASGADYGLAVTGIAGPSGGTPAKPVGLVFIALSHAHGTAVQRHRFLGNRADIKRRAAQAALEFVRTHLTNA